MGYGEFGGGGSVKWEISHTDGESFSGNPHGGNGKDKHPNNETGIFTVIVTEQGKPPVQTTVSVKKGKVRVVWGDPGVALEDIESVAAAPRGSRASKKTSPRRYRRAKS